MTCDEARELAVELALGIADGHARAEALEHIESCPGCRRAVERQADVAAALLSLAPEREPPVGFEVRVAEALGMAPPVPPAPVRPRRRRVRDALEGRRARTALVALLAAAAGATATASVLVGAFSDDRRVADQYRGVLAEANGRYFTSSRLTTAAGDRAGVVFAYEGAPSWVVVTLDRGHRDVARRGSLTTRAGAVVAPPSFRLRAGQASWGGTIPVAVDQLASVQLEGARAGSALGARLR